MRGRGVRRAHERGMQHPRELDVVDVAPLTDDQRGVLLAQRARTDARAGGVSSIVAIFASRLRWPAACFTASTMFW